MILDIVRTRSGASVNYSLYLDPVEAVPPATRRQMDVTARNKKDMLLPFLCPTSLMGR